MKVHKSQKAACQATYFEEIEDKRIFILGLSPPPLGGVSVHILRKIKYLEGKNNRVFLFDVVKKGRRNSNLLYAFNLLCSLFCFKPQIVFYHTLFLRRNLFELIILIFYRFVTWSELILVEHSVRFLYKRSRSYKCMLNLLMRYIGQQVLIGKPMLQGYLDNNIKLRKNHLVESSFIYPVLSCEKQIYDAYPQGLKKFLQSKKKIFIMNASKFDLWDGGDIYGFDLCIKLMNDINNNDIGLVMAVGTIYNHSYYEEIKKKLNCNNTFLALNLTEEIWPLIKNADLFLRPSRFDNYSVSVAEALYLGTPVIASDIGERPSGARLFKSGDYKSFKEQIEDWLKDEEFRNCFHT